MVRLGAFWLGWWRTEKGGKGPGRERWQPLKKLNLNKYCKYSRDKIETRLKNRSVRNLELVIPVLGYGTLWPKIELRAGKGEGNFAPP
jgi:hypothetical protein